MKNVLIAATAALGLMATTAYAGGLAEGVTEPVIVAPVESNVAFVGYAEYGTEAETLEAGVGIEFGVTDRLSLTPTLVMTGTDLEDIDFNEIDITAAYDLSTMVAVQGVFTLDSDFEYKETRFGAVVSVTDALAFTPEVLVDNDFDVQALRLTAGFGLTDNVGVYARVESDADYEYSETVVGVSFKF